MVTARLRTLWNAMRGRAACVRGLVSTVPGVGMSRAVLREYIEGNNPSPQGR